MATCPHCGTHGYEDEAFTLDEIWWAPPLGTWSLSGAQMKSPARKRPRLLCNTCGWYVLGRIDPRAKAFIADPDSQHFPPEDADS